MTALQTGELALLRVKGEDCTHLFGFVDEDGVDGAALLEFLKVGIKRICDVLDTDDLSMREEANAHPTTSWLHR